MAKKPRVANLRERLVTAVFSDSYHALHLVEVRTEVRPVLGDDGYESYRVDKNAVEKIARTRLVRLDSEPRMYFDFVGILVAHDDILNRGRISWATEIEVVSDEQAKV